MIKSIFLSVLLFCTFCCFEKVQGRGSPRGYGGYVSSKFCQGLPAGQYCTKNLNGYYNCNGRNSAGILYKCGRNRRCSCQFDKKCVLPRGEICQQYKKPLPWAPNFMLAGLAIETVTAVDGTVKKQNLHGQVFKNSESGKYRRERWTGSTNNPNTYSFEYLFRQKNGKYLKVRFPIYFSK